MPTDYVPSRDRQPHVREMRYDRGERDRSVLGKRDWHRTSPFGSFERSGSLAPVNGASLGPPNKRRPPGGRHGFSSENGRYNREYGRSSELPSMFGPPYPEKSYRCERGSYPLAGNGPLYAGNPVFDDSDKHLTERSILSRDGREMPSHSHFYHADADRPFTNSSSSAYSPNLDSNKGMELRGWHALYRQDREPKDKVIRSECSEKKPQAKVDPSLDWSAHNHDIEGRLDRYGSSARGESTMTSWLNYSDFSSSSVDWNSKEALPSVTSSSLVGSLKTVTRNHSERTSLFTSTLEKPTEEKVSPPKARPRLGWGQGLAKYEKKKVEGSDEHCNGIDGQARNDNHMEMEVGPFEASGAFQSSDNGSASPVAFDHQAGINSMIELEGFKLEEHNENTALAIESSGSDFLVPPVEAPKASPVQDVLEEEEANDIIQSEQEVIAEPKLMSELQVITSFPEVAEVTEVAEVATFESSDPIQEVPNSEATVCNGIAGELSKEMVLLKIEKVEFEIDLAEKELLKFEKVGGADCASFSTEDCVENDGVEDMKIDEGCKSPFQQLDSGAIDVVPADHLQEGSKKCDHQIWPAAGNYVHALPLVLENQEVATKASKALAHLVKMDEKEQKCQESYTSLTNTPVWKANQETHNRIKKNMQGRLAEEKDFLQFKVKVLALKYKMIKQLENLEQSSANHKRERPKMLRKSETENKIGLSSTNQRISARLKLSSRSDHSMLSGFTKLDAMTEEESCALKKVIDLPITKLRDSLRMPAMDLDPKGRKSQCFITTNALVEDPIVFEKERKGINPWTAEETQIFLEKFAVYSKNFKKIASFLEHKTTGDCVEFYYRNKKSEDFEKLSRRQQLKKRQYTRTNAYLAGSCSRFKDLSADAASETLGGQALSSACYSKVMRTSAISDDVLENASVLKSIMARESKQSSPPAVTSVAVSGAITGLCNLSKDVGPFRASRERPSKTVSACKENCTKPKGMRSSHARRDSTKIASDDAESQWTDSERELFTKAVVLFGKDFKSIALHVGSKTQGQCKTFYSKTRKRLGLDSLVLQCQSSLQDAAVPSFDDVKTLTSEDMEGVEFADKEMMDVTEHSQPVSLDVDANVLEANCQKEQCKFSASEEILRTDEVFEQMESPAALQQSRDIVVSTSEQIYIAHQNSEQKLTQLTSSNVEDDAENFVSPDEECISSTAEKICSFDLGLSTGTTADAMPVQSFAVSDASSMSHGSENHERGDSAELNIKIEREFEAGIGEDNVDVKPLPQRSVSESAVRHLTGKSKAPSQNVKTSSSTGSTKSQINPQVNSIKTHEAGIYQHSLLQQLNSPSVLQALQFLQQPQQQQQQQKPKGPSVSKTQVQNQEVQNQLLLYFQQAAIYQQQQQQQQFQHQQLQDQVIQQIQKLQQQQQPSQQFLHQQQLLLQGVHSRTLPPQAVQHLQKMMATYQLPPVSPTTDVQKQMQQQHPTNQLSQTLPQQQEFSYQQPKKSSQARDVQLQQQQHVSFDQHQLQSFLQQQHIAQFLQCQSSAHAITRPKSAVSSQQNHPYGTQFAGYKVDEQFCQTGQPSSAVKSASACGKEALMSMRGNSKVLLSTDEVSQQVQTSPQLTTPLPKSEPYDLTEARTSDIKLFGQSLLSQPASNAVNCISRASPSLSQQDQCCGSGAFAYSNGGPNAISGESCISFGRPSPPTVAVDSGPSLWHCSSSNLGFWYTNLNGLHSRSGSGVTEVQNAQEVETCRNEREVHDSERLRFLSKEAASCRPRVQTSPHHHALDENKAVDPHLQRVSCDAKNGLSHTSRVDNVNLITKGSDVDRVSSPGNIFETKSMASQALKSVDTMMQQDWSNGSKHSEDVLFWESYRRDMLIDAVKRSALARQSGSEILQHMPLPSQILQVTGTDNWGSLGEVTASNVSLPAAQRSIGYLPSATESVRHTDARGSDTNG